ncbi:hypothetical protein [Aquabacterium sp.]|uniref:hypothetical protein n=1 Tax=Aquabacterium sp. TaxID=1872578 RepID=UPI0019A1E8D7|nr:hypothetical protein [Aquabacterium sp.]MBC7701730.1 hypothetical protein [Aquabacterium sp.]
MSKPTRSPLPAEIRLQQSRERIRLWLTPPDEAPDEEGESSGPALPEQLQAWMRELREHPILSSTFNALQGWWESHPWRPATHLASGLVREALQPLAKKHPLGLVLVAAAIGGSLVWFRPGRGLVKSLLIKGVVSQSVLGLAKQPFVGTLANSVITWMHQLSTPRQQP